MTKCQKLRQKKKIRPGETWCEAAKSFIKNGNYPLFKEVCNTCPYNRKERT